MTQNLILLAENLRMFKLYTLILKILKSFKKKIEKLAKKQAYQTLLNVVKIATDLDKKKVPNSRFMSPYPNPYNCTELHKC